jgi:hypothetical protein
MDEKKTAKYISSVPKSERSWPRIEGAKYTGRTEDRLYLDSKILEGCPVFVEIYWITEIPDPNPGVFSHTHEYDQLLIYMGADPKNSDDLGAELEIELEGEKHIINKTSAIYIPKGMKHCPITHKRVDRPYRVVTVAFSGGYEYTLAK